MDYDYRQIDRWENGHAYTSDGVLLLPTLHVTLIEFYQTIF